MLGLRLVCPTADLKESYLAALREFQKEGLPWMVALDIEAIEKKFSAFVEAELRKKTFWTKDIPVLESEFWAVVGGEFAGRISIRHRLNDDLRFMGGHIGYDTRPSFRGRGVASEMLKQAKPLANAIGISEALLTCNDDNSASIRVIEKNGGVLLERKLQFEGGPMKRYYSLKTCERAD